MFFHRWLKKQKSTRKRKKLWAKPVVTSPFILNENVKNGNLKSYVPQSFIYRLPPPSSLLSPLSSLLPFFSPHLLLLSSTKMEWAPLYEKRYRSYSTEKGLYTIYHSILFYFMSISLLCDYRNHFYIGVFVCIETWIWSSWVKYFALASPVTGVRKSIW